MPSFGKAPVSLRWMLVQMIRETAQHCGHLDLLLDAVRNRPSRAGRAQPDRGDVGQ